MRIEKGKGEFKKSEVESLVTNNVAWGKLNKYITHICWIVFFDGYISNYRIQQKSDNVFYEIIENSCSQNWTKFEKYQDDLRFITL